MAQFPRLDRRSREGQAHALLASHPSLQSSLQLAQHAAPRYTQSKVPQNLAWNAHAVVPDSLSVIDRRLPACIWYHLVLARISFIDIQERFRQHGSHLESLRELAAKPDPRLCLTARPVWQRFAAGGKTDPLDSPH